MTNPDTNPKIVLVPGASRPVGRAIARLFAESGYRLLLPVFGDWPESNEEMADEFASKGYQFKICPCDLTNREEVISMCEAINSEFGAINHLINNIERGGMPILHGSYYKQINAQQWELETNMTIKAKLYLYENALPLLKKCHSSSIINVTSIASLTGRSGPVSPLFSDGYALSNSAVSLFTKTWAREAAPDVRVNEVKVGVINGRHGEGTRGWKLLSADQKEQIKSHTLLQRNGDPDEIADLVYFLAVKATYLTGSTIVADGGFILGGDEFQKLPEGSL
ncbi:MAG: SDR family oxidoreductase [Desulfobulbaceae bacterium]|nr:MAG: SDR family oxidoreductase [Desulfobulbaceae bacterium]